MLWQMAFRPGVSKKQRKRGFVTLLVPAGMPSARTTTRISHKTRAGEGRKGEQLPRTGWVRCQESWDALSETFMAFLDRGESKKSLTACKLPSTDVFSFSFCFFFECCFVSSCARLSLRSQFSPGFCVSHTMFCLYSTLPTAVPHTSLCFALLCSHYSASPTFPLLLSLHAFFLVSLPTCTSPVSTCCS